MGNWKRSLGRITNLTRCLKMRLRGATVGTGCSIGSNVLVHRGFHAGQHGSIRIGEYCTLEAGVVLRAWGGSILLGSYVFLGEYVAIYGHGGVTIGDGTLIAMHCKIVSSNHTIPNRETPIRSQPDIRLATQIGRDVWLGAGVTVVGGVTIGDGCVVAAGAVVTKTLPPFAVAMGVPARIVRYRT